MLVRLLPITLLLALLSAATSQAATVKVPVPAEGQVAVVVAKAPKKAKLNHVDEEPPCGPVMTAITLANGSVVKIHDDWC